MILTWIDYLLIVIILASIIIGLVRGFVKEALSLLIWIVAFVVAIHYSEKLSQLFANSIHNVSFRIGLSFIALLVGVLVSGMLLNFIIGKVVNGTGLSGTNRLLGLIFGFLRGVVLVAGLILLAQLTNLPTTKMWQDSILLPRFQPLTVWLKDLIPNDIGQYFKFINDKTIKNKQQG